jgi:hypothetical protein
VTTGAQLHSAMQSRATMEQYELLRAVALGTALPPEARSGLTILLHRGMWAWVRAIMLGATRQPPAALPMVGLPIADETPERRTVIHLLAAMAMAVSERRKA